MFNYVPNKKEIASIILRAEILSMSSGVAVFEMLDNYSREVKRDRKKVSFQLMTLSKKLKAGRKRWDVYKEFLDKDILKLLMVAEEKSIPAGKILENYAPIKDISEKYLRSIKSSLKSPIGIYVVLSLVFSVVVDKFKTLSTMGEGLSEISMIIINNFLTITGALLVVFVYFLGFIPEKMPLLRGVFSKLNSMLALSTSSIMFKIGYSAVDAIPVLVKQFSIKSIKKRNDAEGLILLLKENKFIDVYEGADMKIAMSIGEFDTSIDRILQSRLNNIDDLNKSVSEVISNITVILTAIPLVLAMSVMANVMTLTLSLMGG